MLHHAGRFGLSRVRRWILFVAAAAVVAGHLDVLRRALGSFSFWTVGVVGALIVAHVLVLLAISRLRPKVSDE